MSSANFASMIGMSRTSLFHKEIGQKPWFLSEILRIIQIMEENGIDDSLTVSIGSETYCITIKALKSV